MKYFVVISYLLIFSNSLSFAQLNENKQEGNILSISGEILMGDIPLQDGIVFLLPSSKETGSTKKTNIFNGRFEFNEVIKGAYIIYVIPIQNYDFFYFPKYLPTYFGNVYKWMDASQPNFDQNKLSGFNINLKSYNEAFYGHGKISGNIHSNSNNRANSEIPISVVLLNENKVPMDFRIVNNDEGAFIFDNLPNGKYYIHPEIPEYNSDDFEMIVKSGTDNNINLNINNNSIQKHSAKPKCFTPIVSKNKIEFYINSQNTESYVCELTDMSGKLIYKKLFPENKITINTTKLSSGIYILRARTYGNSIITTKKVYINNN